MTGSVKNLRHPSKDVMGAAACPARWWHPAGDGDVVCVLCPHHCRIRPGQRGRCLARENQEGHLVASAYGVITSMSVDPIEKKPLNWFMPGRPILSVGSFGCNFHCDFCQNWSIAQRLAPGQRIGPRQLADEAARLSDIGNIGLAFTYNEPLINLEFVIDCAELIRAQGQRCVMVTNGFVEPQPLQQLLPFVDAMNIDLKAFSDDFYRNVCGGRLDPVKQTIMTAASACHVEVATLLIPGLNDSDEEIDRLAAWLAAVNPEIPLHLTRYFPAYQRKTPGPISRERLFHLISIARRHLRRVAPGNLV